MTDDLLEYLAEIVPQARVICAGCPVAREAGQMVRQGDLLYCSDECADRALAVLVKPQPKGVKLDGFDI
jgi:hypothetical protein